jgi:hypothetical protein
MHRILEKAFYWIYSSEVRAPRLPWCDAGSHSEVKEILRDDKLVRRSKEPR